MAEYRSKYSGAEVDALLDKIAEDNVGDIDSALSLESENPVMNKVITEELNKKASNDIVEEISSNISNIQSTLSSKADTNGTYPEMSVGIAEDLMGRPFTVDSAFTFRPTAGAENEIKDDYARIESIKGNSVVWNQKVTNPTFTNKSSWSNTRYVSFNVSNNVATVTASQNGDNYVNTVVPYIVGHKYLFLGEANSNVASTMVFTLYYGTSADAKQLAPPTGNIWHSLYHFFECKSTQINYVRLQCQTTSCVNKYRNITVYDLTQMFGKGNEPTSVEEFYARIPQNIDLYAYNEGEVIHNNTDAVKSVGFNQWDEEWEKGAFNANDGSLIATLSEIRSKNYIPALSNTEYKVSSLSSDALLAFAYDKEKNFIKRVMYGGSGLFTTPQNTSFLKFCTFNSYGGEYKNDICINLSDSSRNGTYEPYISREQRLDIIAKYFPNGMKSAGTAHDEIRYNKATQKWEAVKRIGEVDMGTLNWTYNNRYFYTYSIKFNISQNSFYSKYNALCGKYLVTMVNNFANIEKGFAVWKDSESTSTYLGIKDTSYTDAAAFKTDMSGVMLYYELAEPIVTEIEEDINLDYEVWNGGTEQAIADTPSTPFSAVIEYDFNANETIRQNKADINKIKRALQELKFDFMLPVTYSELVEMRDRGELVAGMQYRITDYVTTTIQENTQSAGHAFDVIVMATDNKTLSEEARAIVHEGDTYFTEAGANLAAWKVWYALDNDSAKFAWADAENGKGVIYRLIDEWNNDCPYDFKNIMFVRFELTSPDTVEDEPWLAQMSANIQAQFTSGQLAYIWSGVNNEDRLWEEDYEEIVSTPTGNTKAFFTFSNVLNNEVFDKSLTPSCHDNSMGKRLEGAEELSNNVFFATSKNFSCHSNSLGNGCHSNSLGNGCYSNSFGDGCASNSLGNGCAFNSLGNGCAFNSFGKNCNYNSFGKNCHSNSFGDGCASNSLGNGCYSNSFGKNCNYNSFGNGCTFNSFGDGCASNSLGNGCGSCMAGNNWKYCRFGNKCYNCSFLEYFMTREPVAYVSNCSWGEGCREAYGATDATASESQQIQNYRIANGMTGNFGVTRGLAYETTIAKATDGTIKKFNLADLAN